MNWLNILKVLFPIIVDVIEHIGKPRASRSTEEIDKEDRVVAQSIASRLRGVASMMEKKEKESKDGGD